MSHLSLDDILLYVGLAVATAILSGLLGGVGWLVKTQGKRFLHMLTASEVMSDPEHGIASDIKDIKDDIRGVKDDVKQLRENGHMFADRVSGIEARVQQGAVELNDLRKEVHAQ